MLIFELVVILFASKMAGDISVRLGQPSVLGKLLIGIVLGPSVLSVVNDTETFKEISQIGVILLMFIAAIGLETKLLSQDIFAVIVVVVLVTTIVTLPMMKWFFKPKSKMESIKNAG
jgi:Kef-type K+ transport system membrane component KefB